MFKQTYKSFDVQGNCPDVEGVGRSNWPVMRVQRFIGRKKWIPNVNEVRGF